jgi:hypothetical protein
MSELTGPIPDSLVSDLEALKFSLANLEAKDVNPVQAGLLAAEISAIRLHLKRLALDQALEPRPPAA